MALPLSPWHLRQAKLEALAAQAVRIRPTALRELAAGKKQGHWVWWVFPTLAARGGDRNSALQRSVAGVPLGAGGADFGSVAEATQYLQHGELRNGLLEAFTVVARAMANLEDQAPFKVLDAGFGRQARGEWVRGPVDAYKLWCCATLFAAEGHRQGDHELCEAALAVLAHFKGDVEYAPAGPGTAGYVEGVQSTHYILRGPDMDTLACVDPELNWDDVVAGRGTRSAAGSHSTMPEEAQPA